jgi:hypothetical protein
MTLETATGGTTMWIAPSGKSVCELAGPYHLARRGVGGSEVSA